MSAPPWDTLSFAASVGDDPSNVRENFRRAAEVLGIAKDRLYVLSQVHGTAHRVLEGTERFDDVVRGEGDITVSRVEGVGCGVRSADCVPVLVADRASGAVAAIHSGWRGTTLGAARAGVAALRALIGARGDLIAAIGPHIEACCFEVGEDVAAQLEAASSAGSRARVRIEDAPRPRVDLRIIVRAQLEEEGVDRALIDDVRGCTACDPASFHSHRRDKDRSGRLLSAIVPRSAARTA